MDKKTICPTITKSNRKKINKRHKDPTPNPDMESKPHVTFCDDSPFDCSMCPARCCCRGLCPPMAWRVSLVEVEPSKESPTVDISSVADQLKPFPWGDSPATTEIIVKIYLHTGKNQSQIAKDLRLSHQYVNQVIKKFNAALRKMTAK